MNTILLGFACVLLGMTAILASPIGQPSKRQERSLKTNEEGKDFLNKEFGHWRPRLRRNANDTDEDETDEDETDGNETGGNETEGNETEGDETDGDETNGNETEGNETEGNETEGNETEGDETDGDETNGNETEGHETDGNETNGNETNGNETDEDEADEDETDGNETDGNETVTYKIDEDETKDNETYSGEVDNETWEPTVTPRGEIIDNDNEAYRRNGLAPRGQRRPRKTDLTYAFISFTKDRPENETRREVERAFKDWSDVTPLKFTETEFRNNASIKLIFRDFNHPADGSPSVIAFVRGSSIHFDDHKNWNGRNLRLITTHELGHVLGLGHSKSRRSIMFREYIDFKNFSLGPEDIARIQAIYGKPTNSSTEKPSVSTLPNTTGILSAKTSLPTRPSTTRRSQVSRQIRRRK